MDINLRNHILNQCSDSFANELRLFETTVLTF